MDTAETTAEALKIRTSKKKTSSKKRVKKHRLESLAKIRRRLMKLWSQRCMELDNNTCALSGQKRDIANKCVLDAHHIHPRQVNTFLRYDPMNSIALTKGLHKFNKLGPHKGSIHFSEWLRNNRPLQYKYVLYHINDELNLNDRKVLAKLEDTLMQPITREELQTRSASELTIHQVLEQTTFTKERYVSFLKSKAEDPIFMEYISESKETSTNIYLDALEDITGCKKKD